jgi:hypothetical protein
MGGPCPPELAGSVDEGRTYQTIANVGIGLAVVGIAAAAVFLVVGLTSNDGEAEALAFDEAGRLRFQGL